MQLCLPAECSRNFKGDTAESLCVELLFEMLRDSVSRKQLICGWLVIVKIVCFDVYSSILICYVIPARLRSQLLFESPPTPKLLNSSSSLAEDASKMVSEVAAAACRLWSIER